MEAIKDWFAQNPKEGLGNMQPTFKTWKVNKFRLPPEGYEDKKKEKWVTLWKPPDNPKGYKVPGHWHLIVSLERRAEAQTRHGERVGCALTLLLLP